MGTVLLLDPELAPALAAIGLATADDVLALGGPPDARHVLAVLDLDVRGTSRRFHLKRYHYAGWERARHLVGRGTLWGTAPEVNEFRALDWLRRRGIAAVRPVAAAARRVRGRLVAHALLTEHVPDATDLAMRLDDPTDEFHADTELRRRVLARVGRDLARMHAGGFVHRDCHARNILVGGPEGKDRVTFLDCRRGGQAGLRHGPTYDLATLDVDLDGRVPEADRRHVLDTWTAARALSEEQAHDARRQVARLGRRIRRRAARRGRARR